MSLTLDLKQTCQVVQISCILYEKLTKIREYDFCLKNMIFLALVLFTKKKDCNNRLTQHFCAYLLNDWVTESNLNSHNF